MLWETPVLALLPDDAVLSDSVTASAQAHLDQHPGDYGGAFPVLMTALGVPAQELNSPRVLRLARNAEAMIRDDTRFVLQAIPFDQVPADRVTIAVGETSTQLHEHLSASLAERLGRQVHRVPGAHEHEVCLDKPEVLGRWLEERRVTERQVPT